MVPCGSKHVGIFRVTVQYKYLENKSMHFFVWFSTVKWLIYCIYQCLSTAKLIHFIPYTLFRHHYNSKSQYMPRISQWTL